MNNPFTEFRNSLLLVQPIIIQGELYTPTEFLSKLIDEYEKRYDHENTNAH